MLKLSQIEYVDWNGLSKEFKQRTGQDWRDYEYQGVKQDFWYYAHSYIFYDNVSNGSMHYFNPWEALEDAKDKKIALKFPFAQEVLSIIIEIFEEAQIENEVQVYIWW